MSLSASACRPQWELVGLWCGFCRSLGFPMVPPEGVCRCCVLCGCLRLHPSVSGYVGRRLWALRFFSRGSLWVLVGARGSLRIALWLFVGVSGFPSELVVVRRFHVASLGIPLGSWCVFVCFRRGLHGSRRGALWATSGCVEVSVSHCVCGCISVGLRGCRRGLWLAVPAPKLRRTIGAVRRRRLPTRGDLWAVLQREVENSFLGKVSGPAYGQRG